MVAQTVNVVFIITTISSFAIWIQTTSTQHKTVLRLYSPGFSNEMVTVVFYNSRKTVFVITSINWKHDILISKRVLAKFQ